MQTEQEWHAKNIFILHLKKTGIVSLILALIVNDDNRNIISR